MAGQFRALAFAKVANFNLSTLGTELETTYNSSSKGYNSFWPLWARHTCRHKHIHIFKDDFKQAHFKNENSLGQADVMSFHSSNNLLPSLFKIC